MTMDSHTGKGVKYTLRAKSLLKRIESERTRQEKRREPKEKPRPPPLSKYRRKTANARERNRMREINEGFVNLQKTLPNLPGADADKLTKITVLKLAVNYIKILSCVMDDDVFVPSDIDQLRKVWCMKNAHMARPEHCVRSGSGSGDGEAESESLRNSPFSSKSKSIKTTRNCSSLKLCNTFRDGAIQKKKTKPSRAKGKVCKTASVATNNGAYITLKNVALQSSGRRPYIDNKPIMMSMTVKRQRLEPISYQRPAKIARYEYEPPVKLAAKRKVAVPFNLKGSNIISRNPIQRNDSVIALSPLSCLSNDTKNQLVVDNSISNFSLYDLDSPTFLKNDIFLELPLPRCESSSSADTGSLYGSSLPSSPNSAVSLPLLSLEQNNYMNESTPSTSMMSPPLFCSSDTESVITTNPDLDYILGSDPFEEELDHLTSSFVDSDDTLSLFLDHTSPNFMTSDINSY